MSLDKKKQDKEAAKLRAMVDEKIECPRCHSLEFNYVRYKDGRRFIQSPCGWQLLEVQGPADDLDVDCEEDEEYED